MKIKIVKINFPNYSGRKKEKEERLDYTNKGQYKKFKAL